MTLKENPFYILDVSLSADRKKIAEAADEIGFLLGEDISSEAQSILINPSKRLGAEMAWFPEASAADIAAIRNSLSSDQVIDATALSGCSRLNAMVYNLGIGEYAGTYDLGFDIVAIDEQYNSIDISKVTSYINQARETAGVAAVSESDVQECHRKSIEEIRKLISEKLKPFDEQAYIDFVTVIGEQYVADKRHNAGPVLFDIIDQYEIRMQSEIDAKATQIIQYVGLIKAEQDKDIIRKCIPKVIERVQAWDVYAQPLQCRSQATGLPHQISSKLAYEMRGLIIYLNNEKNMVAEAKDLASAMKAVFIELGEFKEIFTNDAQTLNEIERNQQNSAIWKSLEAKFKEVESDGKNLQINHDAKKVKAFCDSVESIHREIKNSRLNDKEKEQLRKGLCYTARSQAIDLHNIIKASIDSKYIILVLYDLFEDVPELKEKLLGDLRAFNENPTVNVWTKAVYEAKLLNKSSVGQTTSNRATAASGTASSRTTTAPYGLNNTTTYRPGMPQQPKKKSKVKGFVIAALVLLFIIGISNQNNKTNNTGSRNGAYSTTSSGSTKKTTDKPTTKPTAKPTTVPEMAFSSDSNVYEKVYVDVESVFPKEAIYKEDQLYYSEYVCECTTADGETVWIYFTASEYKKYIDPTVNTLLSDIRSEKAIKFYPAARIYGTVIRTSSLNVTGLLSTIGTLKLIEYKSINIPEQKINVQEIIMIKSISSTYYQITSGSDGPVTHVLCEFTNLSGKKDWLYMSVDDYKKYIDSTANPEKYVSEKKFSSAKSLKVTVQYADSLVKDISKSIGQKTVYSFGSSE